MAENEKNPAASDCIYTVKLEVQHKRTGIKYEMKFLTIATSVVAAINQVYADYDLSGVEVIDKEVTPYPGGKAVCISTTPLI